MTSAIVGGNAATTTLPTKDPVANTSTSWIGSLASLVTTGLGAYKDILTTKYTLKSQLSQPATVTTTTPKSSTGESVVYVKSAEPTQSKTEEYKSQDTKVQSSGFDMQKIIIPIVIVIALAILLNFLKK